MPGEDQEQASREAGQAGENTRGKALGNGKRQHEEERRLGWARARHGRAGATDRPAASSPRCFAAHHAYGIHGVPLSHGPHTQGQDGEVGPGVGAREHEAAPAGRHARIESGTDRPPGAHPLPQVTSLELRGLQVPSEKRPQSGRPQGTASQSEPSRSKPASPASIYHCSLPRWCPYVHSCPLQAIL